MNHEKQIFALIGNLGWPELIVIAAIALLIFGRRLPSLAFSLGQSIIEFRKAFRNAPETGTGSLSQTPKLLDNSPKE